AECLIHGILLIGAASQPNAGQARSPQGNLAGKPTREQRARESCVSFGNMKFYLGSVQVFLGKMSALLVRIAHQVIL
ncbi:hypothetical protein JWR97_15715, partial [Pseudomonas cedrina subsp. fulgida]|nr:hypothetical protein [Pseudomonas cedrina subsp. fulgida]